MYPLSRCVLPLVSQGPVEQCGSVTIRSCLNIVLCQLYVWIMDRFSNHAVVYSILNKDIVKTNSDGVHDGGALRNMSRWHDASKTRASTPTPKQQSNNCWFHLCLAGKQVTLFTSWIGQSTSQQCRNSCDLALGITYRLILSIIIIESYKSHDYY